MLPILALSGAYTVWPMKSRLARIVLASCATIWPATGAFGAASVAGGRCVGVVCAKACPDSQSVSVSAARLDTVLSFIENLQNRLFKCMSLTDIKRGSSSALSTHLRRERLRTLKTVY